MGTTGGTHFEAEMSLGTGLALLACMLAPTLMWALVIDHRVLKTWSFLDALAMHEKHIFDEVIEVGCKERAEYDKLRAVFMTMFKFGSTTAVRKDKGKLLEIFQKYDVDNSKFLEEAEFAAFCREVCGTSISNDRILSLMQVIDREQRSRSEMGQTDA